MKSVSIVTIPAETNYLHYQEATPHQKRHKIAGLYSENFNNLELWVGYHLETQWFHSGTDH